MEPIWGPNELNNNEITEMNEFVIQDRGIAESPILQIAMNYGILPAVLSILISGVVLLVSIRGNIKSNIKADHKWCAMAALAIFFFANMWYGTFYASAVPTLLMGLMLSRCLDNHPNESATTLCSLKLNLPSQFTAGKPKFVS